MQTNIQIPVCKCVNENLRIRLIENYFCKNWKANVKLTIKKFFLIIFFYQRGAKK